MTRRLKVPREEPLDLSTWLASIKKLQAELAQAQPGVDVARALRKAFYLAALTPARLSQTFAPACSEQEFERMLDGGNLEEAAQALIGRDLAMQTSKPDGKLIVTLTSMERLVSGSAASSSLAAAVLGALIAIMRDAGTRSLASNDPLTTGPRKSRPAPLPSSTWH